MASSNECASMDRITIPTGSYRVATSTRACQVARISSACCIQILSTRSSHQVEHRGCARWTERLLELIEHHAPAFGFFGFVLALLQEHVAEPEIGYGSTRCKIL